MLARVKAPMVITRRGSIDRGTIYPLTVVVSRMEARKATFWTLMYMVARVNKVADPLAGAGGHVPFLMAMIFKGFVDQVTIYQLVEVVA
jgi:hypothetical protein